MFSPRRRKIWSDVWAYKGRTLLIVLSIALGMIAVGASLGTRAVLNRELTNAYQGINPAHVIVHTEPLAPEALQLLQALPEVAVVEGRASRIVQIPVGSQQRNLVLYSMPNFAEHSLNQIKPYAGAWPPASNEMILEHGSIEFLESNLGQSLIVEATPDQRVPLSVVGIARDLYILPGVFNGGGVGYISSETFERLFGSADTTELHILFNGTELDRPQVEALGELVFSSLETQGYRVVDLYVASLDQHPLGNLVSMLCLVLGALGLLTLFLSGLLVSNTLQLLLQQQTRQIGIMKSLGATGSNLMWMYLEVVAWFCGLGLLIGYPGAVVGMRLVSQLLADTLNIDLAMMQIPHGLLIGAMLLGLVLPMLLSFGPIRAAGRTSLLKALSFYGVDSRFGSSRFDRFLSRMKGFSRPVLLGLRNTFRSKKRLRLTLAALVVASMLMVAVGTLHASLQATLQRTAAYFGDDVSIELFESTPHETLLTALEGVEGVEQVELWNQTPASWKPEAAARQTFVLWALPATTEMLHPVLLEGRWLADSAQREVVINSYLSDPAQLINVGDTLPLQIKGSITEWTVVGIIQGVPNGIPPQPYVYISDQAYATTFNEPGLARRVQVITTLHDQATRSAVAADVALHLKQAGLPIKSVITAHDLQSAFASVFNIIVLLVLVMGALMALVGGLGLLGMLSLNAAERQKEFAIMRSLGADNKALLKIGWVEALTMAGLSWLLGTLLAVPFGQLLTHVVGQILLAEPLVHTFSWLGLAIWSVLLFMLASGAAILPMLRVLRLSIRAALAYE